MDKIEKFYIELGYKTQQTLQKVRGVKTADMTWEVFSTLPAFKQVMSGRKTTNEQLIAFKTGFERAIEHQKQKKG